MKKITLISFAILGLAFAGFSQDNITMKVEGETTDYSSGHSPYILEVNSPNIYEIIINVNNSTGNDKSWRITRLHDVNTPSSWYSNICVVSKCFPTSQLNPYCTPANTPQDLLCQLTIPNSETKDITLHVFANCVGTGNYRLYLGDCNNFEDSIDVQINFTLGIDEKEKTNSFTMSPNPSNDIVTIQSFNKEVNNLKIIDIIGNVVYEEKFTTSTKINVSDYKNGMYLVMTEFEGKTSSPLKLAVKH